jgi:hypothetical protein
LLKNAPPKKLFLHRKVEIGLNAFNKNHINQSIINPPQTYSITKKIFIKYFLIQNVFKINKFKSIFKVIFEMNKN